MLRGSSISIVKSGDRQLSGYNAKSWAELATFFDREKNAEGRQYKKDISKQIQEYRGWVFAAVDCIVDRMCSIDVGFYKVSNDEKINPRSGGLAIQAIAKPIIHPNDYMSFDFILQWCQTQLDLCGKAAILKLPNALGKTWELWPMDMNYFEGVEKGESYLSPPKGFKFRMDSKVYLFPPSRIIWLRYAHPEDLWDGFSPIQAQAYTTDIEYYMEVYERGFFKNSARVDFVIQAEGNVDEGEASRIKETWIQKYGGVQKSYEPAVLSGGLKVVPITMSNADFQFLELAKWTKERILASYRVPEGKLGLFADINRANQRGIDIAFNEEAIKPRLKLWQVELNKQLIVEYTGKIELRFDNPVPRDREMDLQELKLRSGGNIPLNTINELRNWWDGEKPTDGGDVILIDNKLIPLSAAGNQPTVPPSGGGGGSQDGGGKPGDGGNTPAYDPEHQPGGDEKLLIDYIVKRFDDKAIATLVDVYKKALEYTHGWSIKKAVDYAKGIKIGLPEIFVDCVSKGLPAEEYSSMVKQELVKMVFNKIKSQSVR